jgi:hypothetical protein
MRATHTGVLGGIAATARRRLVKGLTLQSQMQPIGNVKARMMKILKS